MYQIFMPLLWLKELHVIGNVNLSDHWYSKILFNIPYAEYKVDRMLLNKKKGIFEQ